MAEEKSNKEKKDIIESVKEKVTEFVDDTKNALDIAETALNENLSKKNIEIAKEKVVEFAIESKETFENLKENASEIASEVTEHLTHLSEDVKEEIKEVKETSKNFIQRLFGK